ASRLLGQMADNRLLLNKIIGLADRLAEPASRNKSRSSPRVMLIFRKGRLQYPLFVKHASDLKHRMQYEYHQRQGRHYLDKGANHCNFFTDEERVADIPIWAMRNQPPRFRHDAECSAEPAQHDK